jgi:hypothetical protein
MSIRSGLAAEARCQSWHLTLGLREGRHNRSTGTQESVVPNEGQSMDAPPRQAGTAGIGRDHLLHSPRPARRELRRH